MKTLKLPSILLSLVIILSACNLPSSIISQTQTANQNLTDTIIAMTMQGIPTGTPIDRFTTTNPLPTEAALPLSTPAAPNVPVWSVYDYTCQLADGGGDMTMNLGWTDRSDSEEGYKIYQDGLVIATLAPNSTFYVDMAFVAAGNTLSYSVEAFNKDWQAMSSTLSYGCQ